MIKANPEVTVVIPHWNGKEILRRCLESLQKTQFDSFSVLVVNNGSSDDSMDMVSSNFQDVQTVHSGKNLGFAGGCNLGIRNSSSPYIALLNNDAEVKPDWLGPLVRVMEEDYSVAAVQPKILSIKNPNQFDYCGGAGGEIDLFGYPYAWGRLFDTIEEDENQYDARRAVFWASGAACLLRRSALNHVGLLDEMFFAHMEEIDLNWRMQIAGYNVMVEPKSVVYHQTGATLNSESMFKMVLNHRNNLIMQLKNHSLETLFWIFPLRLLLEGVTLITALFMGQFKRMAAVIIASFSIWVRFPGIIRNRKRVQALWRIQETSIQRRMYRGSLVFSYFVRGIRKASDL